MSGVLSRLSPPAGSRRVERRLGRGPGSGVGKTSGKGMKGQKARHPGGLSRLRFQGGQTPIQRRLPKRGFRLPFPETTVAINVGELERLFASGADVDEQALRKVRLVQPRGARVKILGGGELKKKLTVRAYKFSVVAAEKIAKAGGKAITLAPPPESAG